MTPSTVSDQIDAPTGAVLGIEQYLERLDPDSSPGESRLANPATFGPSERRAWQSETEALRDVENWVEDHPDQRDDLRELLAPLPAVDAPLQHLDTGTILSEGDLFDLKRFAYYGRRALETAGSLLPKLDPPPNGVERLEALVRTIHPGGRQTPRFHLSGDLDGQLRTRLERKRDIASKLETLRDQRGETVVERWGGSCGLRGRYRPPEDLDEDELERSPHLERRGGGWHVVSEQLRELEANLAAAREELEETEERVRRELTDELVPHSTWMTEMADFLATLDVRLAKVRLKRDLDGCWGRWETDDEAPTLEIRGGREPRVERLVESTGGSIQPIDFSLPRRPAIVTGPNMGGKSALLQLAGLCQWCAQHACPVPADTLNFRPVRSIVYVGSEEPRAVDASRGLSSFGREVRRLVGALEDADRPVLWILDEVGRGTHPKDGAALARDLLETLAERGDPALAATHFPALADADSFPTYRIRGLDGADSLEDDLAGTDTVDKIERRLREAMDFQTVPGREGTVPRDARRVARALGLDVGEG